MANLFALPYAEGNLYRPISNLSFALNWYFGQDNPFGYHFVNLLIHILTAIFLYKTTLQLLRSPSIKKYSEQDIFFIALLSSLLWAINPVQNPGCNLYSPTHGLNECYVFYICNVHLHLCSPIGGIRTASPPPSVLRPIFLLALGCKENAVTLIPACCSLNCFF